MAQNAAQIRPMVAGNWKMNGTKGSLAEVARVGGGLGAGGPGRTS